jgi:hypothetical protein
MVLSARSGRTQGPPKKEILTACSRTGRTLPSFLFGMCPKKEGVASSGRTGRTGPHPKKEIVTLCARTGRTMPSFLFWTHPKKEIIASSGRSGRTDPPPKKEIVAGSGRTGKTRPSFLFGMCPKKEIITVCPRTGRTKVVPKRKFLKKLGMSCFPGPGDGVWDPRGSRLPQIGEACPPWTPEKMGKMGPPMGTYGMRYCMTETYSIR